MLNYIKDSLKRYEVQKLLKQVQEEEIQRREEQLLASLNFERSEGAYNGSKKVTHYIPKGAVSKPYDYDDPYTEPVSHPSFSDDQGNSENFMNICNTFWRPSLTFNPYIYGDHLVDFGSLWPDEDTLETLMLEAYQATALRRCLLEICKLVVRCGPLRVLKTLIERRIVSVDQVFENGSNMLHKAVIAQNFDSVLFLLNAGINAKLQDKEGRTTYQVCHNPRIRRMLPVKSKTSLSKEGCMRVSSLHDREILFQLARNMDKFDELQIKLQTTNFNVNSEFNDAGDYLVHIGTREGIWLFPQLLSLVQIQGADIDLENSRGMTPLMIAAENGDSFLADVLMCIIGANPNKPNPSNGWISLHYAAKNNHVDVLSCLIKRGADLNVEDRAGRRPDDIAELAAATDCMEMLLAERSQRIELLTLFVEQDTLKGPQIRTSDLYSVDRRGQSLIMTAAINNRTDVLTLLTDIEGSPIDAQHEKTGRTALSMAASLGHLEAVKILFSHEANPRIRDMNGDLALHLAVLGGHDLVVLHLLQFPSSLTGLHRAWRLAKSNSLRKTIKSAIRRRQNYLVTPALFECSLTGNAEALYCLLEEGDRTNIKSGVGDWPMYLAAENGHLEVMKLLYEYGGDVERAHPSTGNTVLHIAVTRGHYRVVQYLMQFCKVSGVNIPPMNASISLYQEVNINAANAAGKTSLQMAAEKGNSRIVGLLIAHGATTALLDSYGELFNCYEYQGIQVMLEVSRADHVTQLIKCVSHGSKAAQRLKSLWQPPFDHNLVTREGDTVLMVACRMGKVELVKFLLESAVYEVNDRSFILSSDDSETEIELCDRVESLSTIDEMCDSGHLSEQSESLSSYTGTLASHHPDLLCTPLNSGQLNPEQKNSFAQEDISGYHIDRLSMKSDKSIEDEMTSFLPQSHLQASGNIAVISSEVDNLSLAETYTNQLSDFWTEKLSCYGSRKVSHVCTVNKKTGESALHYAVKNGSVAIVTALIDADNACINIQDGAGISPLHLAMRMTRKRIVEKLVTFDFVDLNCRTLDGKLAEEMTQNKALMRIITDARHQCQDNRPLSPLMSQVSVTTSVYSGGGSSIDFEKINTRFVQMKQQLMS